MAGGYQIGLWSLLIAAAICDLIWHKIFNWVNGLFLLGGLFTQFYFGGSVGMSQAFLAVVVAFVFFFPLYLIKALAAGDVKLLMAVGAWSDTKLVIELGLVAIVTGAVVGAVVLFKKKGFKNTVESIKAHAKQPSGNAKQGLRIPFAPAFLCAFFVLQILEKYR